MKTDSERGPWGAWAYNTRDRLGLALEQVAADLGYSDGSMRKAEAGSPGYQPPSRPVRRALSDYYSAKADEMGITIDPPPRQDPRYVDVMASVTGTASAEATASVVRQAEAVAEMARTVRGIAETQRSEVADLQQRVASLEVEVSGLRAALEGLREGLADADAGLLDVPIAPSPGGTR